MKTFIKKYLRIFTILGVTSLTFNSITSCNPYPSSDDYVKDYDLVYTNYNQTKNFSSYTTFALPNKIPFLNSSYGTTGTTYLDDTNPSTASLIKQNLINNLTARGYKQITASTTLKPDLMVNVGVLNNNVSGSTGCWWYNNPYYWDWYPDWAWGNGYNWGYYPCYGSYYSYNIGSLVVDLVDVAKSTGQNCNQPNSNCKLDIAWNSIINGLLTNTSDVQNRITTNLNQAFSQSPYLKK